MSEPAILLGVCVAYFAVVVAIGWAAWRHGSAGAEDYFLAGRTARTVVLFMALFGTNVTPFVLMRDVLRRLRPDIDAKLEVRWARAFVLVFAVATWVIALLQPASIFRIASFSFSGYVMLVPTLYLGLRWARFTAVGAIASIVVGNAVLVGTWFVEPAPFGVLPVAWGLAAGIVAAVIGSRFGTPSPEGAVAI